MNTDDDKAIERAASALLNMHLNSKKASKAIPLPTRKGPERRYRLRTTKAGKPKIVEVE